MEKYLYNKIILEMFKFCNVSIHKIGNTYIIDRLLQSNETLYCYFENGINWYGISEDCELIKFSSRTVNVMIECHISVIVNNELKALGVIGIDKNIKN